MPQEHRAEIKVYMTHTELWMIQEAAKETGRSLSSYMKFSALVMAEVFGVKPKNSLMARILAGQLELVPEEVK